MPDPDANGTYENGPTVALTRDGRRALETRALELREEVIPQRLAQLEGRDPGTDAYYAQAVGELAELDYILRWASATEDLPADPKVAEVGDAVTLRFPGGDTERYLIVHPMEAPLDRTRISFESPLARAVLGRSVGEDIEVSAPSGAYRCTIVSVGRGAGEQGTEE